MIPIIVIAGPTASGKTALSIELAKRLDGEIISCDSMQVYKGMDIGTAKPTKEEQAGIPHHLIDFLEPTDNFSVASFCAMAHSKIEEVSKREKMPILVGGTGLYIDSLINNVNFLEEKEDKEIREELTKIAETKGAEALFDMLLEIDPEYAKTTHPNNLKRVIRAIEFYKLNGMTVTEHNNIKKEPRYKSVYFCIDWDRAVLYERINQRVDMMIDDGLLDEAKMLYDKYNGQKLTALQSIGYKEFFEHFDGNKTFDEAVEEIKQGSRHYAKRQLTWFRRNENIHWLTPNDDMVERAMEIVKQEL